MFSSNACENRGEDPSTQASGFSRLSDCKEIKELLSSSPLHTIWLQAPLPAFFPLPYGASAYVKIPSTKPHKDSLVYWGAREITAFTPKFQVAYMFFLKWLTLQLNSGLEKRATKSSKTSEPETNERGLTAGGPSVQASNIEALWAKKFIESPEWFVLQFRQVLG